MCITSLRFQIVNLFLRNFTLDFILGARNDLFLVRTGEQLISHLTERPHIGRHIVRFPRSYFWCQGACYVKSLRYCVILLQLKSEVEATELQMHLLFL